MRAFKLKDFDGPLDLLLTLIGKAQIDIKDIFVSEITDQYLDIVRNATDLASIFGAKVCVEGIETAGMRDILRTCYVSSFQGYYYAKPLPPEDIPGWKVSERK